MFWTVVSRWTTWLFNNTVQLRERNANMVLYERYADYIFPLADVQVVLALLV